MKASKLNNPDLWLQRQQPPTLERKYQFSTYSSLREFLDRAADLSKEYDYYPNLGFGCDYVNVTLYAKDQATQLQAELWDFANSLDALVPQSSANNHGDCAA